MTYTKIGLFTTGTVKARVSCDLETGRITIANRVLNEGSLRKYAPLSSSCNLDERHLFDFLKENLSDQHYAITRKKKLARPICLELSGLVNDPSLEQKDSEFCWSYRDGWSVWIGLSGSDVPYKTLGPFTNIDPKSKTDRIISLVSDNGKLFFL